MSTTEQLFEQVMTKVNLIYGIFKDQFGESKVDLQFNKSDILNRIGSELRAGRSESQIVSNTRGSTVFSADIIVWWPDVLIENESGDTHPIKDLYAKVQFYLNGALKTSAYSKGFALNRATYTIEEWQSNYMHSHVSCIPTTLSEFVPPCTGSGPINQVADALRRANDLNDEDFSDWWGTYAYELDRYVYVESIRGVPYHRMSSIGRSSYRSRYYHNSYLTNYSSLSTSLKQKIGAFFDQFMSTVTVPVNLVNGIYTSNIKFTDFCFKVSNAFITYFNDLHPKQEDIDLLYRSTFLIQLFVGTDGGLYNSNHRSSGGRTVPTSRSKIVTFKGNPVYLSVSAPTVIEEGLSTFIDPSLLSYIYNSLIVNLNITNGKPTDQA